MFGGEQLRPNLHIEDMTDLYVDCLELPDEAIDGKIYNAGYENHTVMRDRRDGARRGRRPRSRSSSTPTDDQRSYHVSSEKIRRELGFAPKRTIDDAIARPQGAPSAPARSRTR